MVKTWLITGGCGFIGTAVIARLLERDSEVRIRVLDNLSVGQREDLSRVCTFTETMAHEVAATDGVSLVVGDILDSDTALACAQGADVILHLAANTGVGPSVENPRFDMEQNVRGTFNMLEAARAMNVRTFIFASSGAPAGEVEPPIHEELAPHPVSPYGASKLAGEGYCSAYFRTFGVKTVALRFGNVYGPLSSHKSSVVAKFIRQAFAGEPCEIYGDGTQTRDFIYIYDLVDAVLRSAYSDVGGETFQIATGRENTVQEVAEIIREELESSVGIAMDIRHGKPRLGDVTRNYSDTSKAKARLGWTPKRDLRDGIRETIRYFQSLNS